MLQDLPRDKWNSGILLAFSQAQTSDDDSLYGVITVEEFSRIPEFDILLFYVCWLFNDLTGFFFYPLFLSSFFLLT